MANQLRSWTRKAAGSAIAAAALLASAPAWAGNITINTSTIRYLNTESGRQSGSEDVISYTDCVKDKWQIQIPVTVTTGSTPILYASETADCTNDVSRQDTTACTPLTPTSAQSGVYTLTAKQIATTLDNVDKSTCIDSGSQTAVRSVALFFILPGTSTSGTVDAANYAKLTIQVDLLGPAAPTSVSVDATDGALSFNIPNLVDAETQGYYVFISPNPKPADEIDGGGDSCPSGTGGSGGTGGSTTTTTATTATGGTGGAGGATTTTTTTTAAATTTTTTTTDGTGGASSACAAGITLPCVDPARPSLNSSSRYDVKLSRTAKSTSIDGLSNGQSYTVAVAAYDAVNNIGPLSVIQCGTPAPTDTFVKEYCKDGGSACIDGCGACRIGGDAGLAWPSLFAAGAAAMALGMRRRRRGQHRDVTEIE
jgi:hypothetical protein